MVKKIRCFKILYCFHKGDQIIYLLQDRKLVKCFIAVHVADTFEFVYSGGYCECLEVIMYQWGVNLEEYV